MIGDAEEEASVDQVERVGPRDGRRHPGHCRPPGAERRRLATERAVECPVRPDVGVRRVHHSSAMCG